MADIFVRGEIYMDLWVDTRYAIESNGKWNADEKQRSSTASGLLSNLICPLTKNNINQQGGSCTAIFWLST